MALGDTEGDWETNPFEDGYVSEEKEISENKAPKNEGRNGKERSSVQKENPPIEEKEIKDFAISEYPYEKATPLYAQTSPNTEAPPLTEADFKDYTKEVRYVPPETFDLSTLRFGQIHTHFDGGSTENFLAEELCERMGIEIVEKDYPEYCDVLRGEVTYFGKRSLPTHNR